MKAITLTQPWATLVAIGAKRIETRSWPTSYRGPLAIHAAKGFRSLPGGNLTDFCLNEPFRTALTAGGVRLFVPGDDLPLGAVVATARIALCCPTEYADRQIEEWGAEHEREFGDYSPGRYLWVLADVVALPTPLPARGALGLWEWDAPPGVQL